MAAAMASPDAEEATPLAGQFTTRTTSLVPDARRIQLDDNLRPFLEVESSAGPLRLGLYEWSDAEELLPILAHEETARLLDSRPVTPTPPSTSSSCPQSLASTTAGKSASSLSVPMRRSQEIDASRFLFRHLLPKQEKYLWLDREDLWNNPDHDGIFKDQWPMAAIRDESGTLRGVLVFRRSSFADKSFSDRELARRLAVENKARPAGDEGIVWTFGYYLHPDLRGQNIMTQLVQALISYASGRINARHFRVHTRWDNLASRRVLEKVGFTCSGQPVRVKVGFETKSEPYLVYCLDLTGGNQAARDQ